MAPVEAAEGRFAIPNPHSGLTRGQRPCDACIWVGVQFHGYLSDVQPTALGGLRPLVFVLVWVAYEVPACTNTRTQGIQYRLADPHPQVKPIPR